MLAIRKKQRKLYIIMKTLITISVTYILIYIGIQPTVQKYNVNTANILYLAAVILMFISMIFIFMYYSKYGKCNNFLDRIEKEISDNGYYYSNSTILSTNEYINNIVDKLKEDGFLINSNVTIDDFDFDYKAVNKSKILYIANINDLDKNDVIAYIDTVINDVSYNVIRKGNIVITFVSDSIDDSSIELSKSITVIGKKEQIKITISIIDTKCNKVYFLGNDTSVCQSMIVKYNLFTKNPISNDLICKDRLKFQQDVQNRMDDFNIKDYNNGTFYVH